MSWNYRLVDQSQPGLPCVQIVECHYNEADEPEAYTDIFTTADTPQEMVEILEQMIKDIQGKPVLKATDFPEPQESKP